MSILNKTKLIFDGYDFDERTAYEARAGGYLSHVHVLVPNGKKYPVIFYCIARIGQTLELQSKYNENYISEPGLIILPEVTFENMQITVDELYRNGYFESLFPAPCQISELAFAGKPVLIFKGCEFDEKKVSDALAGGHLSGVFVLLPNGNKYPISFYDLKGIRQKISASKDRKKYVADIGLIVISEITIKNLQAAVEDLYEVGHFNNFVPCCRVPRQNDESDKTDE